MRELASGFLLHSSDALFVRVWRAGVEGIVVFKRYFGNEPT
ncbi:hypothetical protein [Mesorhizobium sp.]|nr:hypothetical protein [Mesorhizobium sp.]